MRSLLDDLRYAVRMMLKSPGFSLVALVTLALGIGANTAIFTVADAVILRPLPFRDPDRLVLLWGDRPREGYDLLPFSWQNFAELREQATSFESLGAFFSYPGNTFNLTASGEPERIQAAYLSAGVLPALGVAPPLGRAFTAGEDRPGAERVVLISDSLWRRRFGAAPDVVGRTLSLDGHPHTITGVMPESFTFPRYPSDADVWLPLALEPNPGRRFSRGTKYLSVIGRLKPGTTIAEAQAEVTGLARRLAEEYPRFNHELGVKVTPLSLQAAGSMKPALVVLAGAVGLVLLIACANIANLLLARARAREREIAVRVALGASRARLVRQWLTESGLLALTGGGLGLLLAVWGLDLLSFIPYNAPSLAAPYVVSPGQIALRGEVLAFALGISLATGLLFGTIPALQSARGDPAASLRGASATPGARGRRAGTALVVLEMALSLVLLAGAGLLIRSFLGLSGVDPGFRADRIVTAEVNLPRSKYPTDALVTAFYDQLLSRLRGLPGSISAGATMALPLGGSDESTGFIPESPTRAMAGLDRQTHPRPISEGYLESMGIRVRSGRGFTDGDTAGSPRVALVNEAMARRFWPGESPVGRRIALDFEAMRFFPDRPPERDLAKGLREIVGVVADVRHAGLDAEPFPEMYVPVSQSPNRDLVVVLRTDAREGAAAAALRSSVLAIDAEQPVANVRTMAAVVEGSVARARFNSVLMALFAALALLLAAVGVFGVVSYSVAQRTREFALRMALGARGADVLRMVLREGLRTALAGIAIGLASAAALTRALSSLLYGVGPTDTATFVAVAALLAAVALGAAWLPARRAMKVSPMDALRCD